MSARDVAIRRRATANDVAADEGPDEIMVKTLRLTDDIQHRIALARWTADKADTTALVQRKLDLADAVLTAVERSDSARLARLERITRPAALKADVSGARARRRA